ncbi:MAG TPA: hypothetical protein PKE47_17250, partial [Verrucomicrobiota bacterium]|nr:hypothetical protein [Verrucomicrobiota bacterium]
MQALLHLSPRNASHGIRLHRGDALVEQARLGRGAHASGVPFSASRRKPHHTPSPGQHPARKAGSMTKVPGATPGTARR